MKSRTTLTMMELVIMLLVFALAAALCLQAFAGAEQTSARAAALDRAAGEARNAAETLKGCSGDFERAAALYGGSWDGQQWSFSFAGCTLRARPIEGGPALLGQAEITVTDPEGAVLYSITAAWQKEGSRHE